MRDYSDFLQKCSPPWIISSGDEMFDLSDSSVLDRLKSEVNLYEIDARGLSSVELLLDKFSEVFKFPDYFGGNFSALVDCLSDGDILPEGPAAVIIRNSNCLLVSEKGDALELLMDAFIDVSERWAAPQWPWEKRPTPFHVILIPSDEGNG